MFDNHYEGWRQSRLDGLSKHVGMHFVKSKTILEVGCGYGDIGNSLSTWGAASVTCSDAREEHLQVLRERYPHLSTLRVDLETQLDSLPFFDIIVHFGVLYHLSNIQNHFNRLKCNYLFLETCVYDASDESFITIKEEGYDQSFSGVGTRPSPSYVERLLSTAGFEAVCIKDPILNHVSYAYNSDMMCTAGTSQFLYDWEVQNSRIWYDGMHRFWVCWKKGMPSPLIQQSSE